MSVDASSLLHLERCAAVFKPGQTALGHRWVLQDGDGTEVGHTKLFYEGAGKTMGRLMRVTGLSTSGTLHAIVLGTGDEELFRVHSWPGKDAHVDLVDSSGTLVGCARRRELSLDLLAPGSEVVLGRITRTSRDDLAFPIEDAAGERIGMLTKQKLQVSAPSITEMVFLPDVASNTVAFQATMHLGFAGSREYHLLVERQPDNDPLRTLLALAPLLAAYAY